MKKIISVNKHSSIIVNEQEQIIDVRYYNTKERICYDYNGSIVPAPKLKEYEYEDEDETDDPTQYSDLHNGFYSYTTHEVEETVDDTFGLFGIKDKHGNVIVEEEYWDVGRYSNGLCPVRAVNGDWGCVNEKGELVLPCIYWDAPVFNKYGVAYGNNTLIDMQGNEIEDTRYNLFEYVDEDDRYYEIVYYDEEQEAQIEKTGCAEGSTMSIYDTKERKYVVRNLPEDVIDCSFFDGDPEVINAAVELIDEYERITFSGNGIIEGYKDNRTDIYDYYE